MPYKPNKNHTTDKMITIMEIILLKIIDESKNKSLLPKMSNKKMSLKTFFKINNESTLHTQDSHSTLRIHTPHSGFTHSDTFRVLSAEYPS